MKAAMRRALFCVGIGIIIGPLISYLITVIAYLLVVVSKLALKGWETSLIIGWCLAIPTGALVGLLRLNWRSSLLAGALSAMLFTYAVTALLWRFQDYPDISWLMAMLGNGIGIALLLRWLSVKIIKDFKELSISPYDRRIKWLAGGTVFVLMFLWGIGLFTIPKPKLAKAQFKAIVFQPNPARVMWNLKSL